MAWHLDTLAALGLGHRWSMVVPVSGMTHGATLWCLRATRPVWTLGAERFLLGEPFELQLDRLARAIDRTDYELNGGARVAIDQTGLGQALVELAQRRIRPCAIGASIAQRRVRPAGRWGSDDFPRWPRCGRAQSGYGHRDRWIPSAIDEKSRTSA